MPKLTLRIDLGPDEAVGPGKIRLLEAVRDCGSISRAGRSLGMSYRRAWLLIDGMNQCFRRPVAVARPGGQHGGASVTEFGLSLIGHYRRFEAKTHEASAKELRALARAIW